MSSPGNCHDMVPTAAIHREDMRMPEVAIRTMNPPPQLPGKQQKYFFTRPDATFNASNEDPFAHLQRAEDTEEFEYGGANRLGTQTAYLNIPHRVQKGLMPLMLPNAKETGYGNQPFVLPFPHLQKGDIAFYLRLENDWHSEAVQRSLQNPSCSSSSTRPPLALVCEDWEGKVHATRRKRGRGDEIASSLMMHEGAQLFVNLQTVNYILHGIQHYKGSAEPAWRDSFWKGFGLHRLHQSVKDDPEKLCTHVIRGCMTPFGVITSEVSHRSDQAVSMVVDGRIEEGIMRNYWAEFVKGSSKQTGPDEVAMPQAGDELILVLEEMSIDLDDFDKAVDKWTYVLPNHHSRGAVRMVFPFSDKKKVWQLVPSFLSATNRACWERRGFWRLGTVH